MKKEGMSRTGFWIFVLIIFAVIIGAFVFFYSVSDRFDSDYLDIDSVLIEQGVQVDVNENTIVRFDYSGKSYSIFFDEFSDSLAKIKIGINSYELGYSNTEVIDLDSDSYEDLILEVREIGNQKSLYLEFIGNEFCVEDWECTEWGPCIDESIKRVCLDQNQCGTVEFRPEVQRSC